LTLQNLCPSCGEPSDGVCERCLAEHRSINTIPKQLTIKMCPTCSAHFFKGHWLDEDLDHAVDREIQEALTVDKAGAAVNVDLSDVTPTMVRAHVKIDSTLGDRLRGSYDVNIRVNRASCDRCSRIAGSYYESKVQIRAERRTPSSAELSRALDIASAAIHRARKADRLAFIAKNIQLREGVDLYVGTIKAAKRIVSAVVQEMGGTVSDSAKLIGRRDGKDIYRVTFVVRLPEFPVGSIVWAKKRIYEICSATSTNNAVDLETGRGAALTTQDLRSARLLGDRTGAKRSVLVSVDGDEAHLLDPETYVPLAVKRPLWVRADDQGKEIQVVNTREGVIILP